MELVCEEMSLPFFAIFATLGGVGGLSVAAPWRDVVVAMGGSARPRFCAWRRDRVQFGQGAWGRTDRCLDECQEVVRSVLTANLVSRRTDQSLFLWQGNHCSRHRVDFSLVADAFYPAFRVESDASPSCGTALN